MSILKRLFTALIGNTTYSDNRGYKRHVRDGKLVSRFAAEKKLGRKLRPGEVVHHRDRDKSNNSFSNLWVFSNWKAHNKVHWKDLGRTGKW